jgi:hypothetical protein
MRIAAAGGLGLFLIASLPMPSLLAAQASMAGHAADYSQSEEVVVAAASVAALTVRGEAFLAAAPAPLTAARVGLARLAVASIAVAVLPRVAGATAPTWGAALALP